MKRLALILVTVCISILNAYSQTAKLQTARNFYGEPYKQYDKAKEAIDEVVLHEKTKGMAKAWFTRGQIYHALYKDPKYGSLCDNCLSVSYESYKKAMELEPDNEWAPIIENELVNILGQIFNEGVVAYQKEDYNTAMKSFEEVQRLQPGDTASILNAAYTAEHLNNLEKAKENYSKLIAMKYPDPRMYLNLANVQKQMKDSAAALQTIMKGREIYPDTLSLLLAQINILLAAGKSAEATKALSEATAKDPNNPNIYLALGSSYDNMANPKGADGKDLAKPKDYNELMIKAEEAYLNGLKVAPDDYQLNFNLGAMYFNQAAEMTNQANKITDNVAYEKAKTKFEAKFKQSEPYLRKSMETNPKKTEDDVAIYQGTLNSLKQLYAKTGETAKYDEIKALMDKK
jgi:tetratricopeptide (TPR) repeat protein